MIHHLIEQAICGSIEELMISDEQVAHVSSTHTLNHSLLVLSQVKYSSIPVLTPKSEIVGLITMSNIINAVTTLTDIDLERLHDLKVCDIELNDAPTITMDAPFEYVLGLLTDYNYLCVIQSEEDAIFKGIITRRVLLKRITHLIHNLETETYAPLVKALCKELK
ncbi:CBS domain-containing protein [Aerococcaceae bacterium NML160702]|nr:CBS domain-containing protein [Aerococcaceae bacterium NML160702]